MTDEARTVWQGVTAPGSAGSGDHHGEMARSGTSPSRRQPQGDPQVKPMLERDEKLLGALPSWARAFPGTPEHARAARRFVTGLLQGSPLCDDAALVLSELFTNAVMHTASGAPGGLVIVQVTRWRLGVRVAVTDQGSPSRPVVQNPAGNAEPAESGHGLYLANHLAERLDWHDDPSGRTIAAILGRFPHERDHRSQSPSRGDCSSCLQPA